MGNRLPLILLLIATVFIPVIADADGLTSRSVIRENVKHDGQVDAELAGATGLNTVNGFSWQMFLVDDLSGTTTLTRFNRDFRTEQAFKFKVEAYTDMWIYVMNVEPSGKMVTLLPELGEQHLLVRAGQSVMVPPDGQFRFVGEAGVEQFRIIASPKKLKWVNPESLWKLDNGDTLPPEEERVARAQERTRSKSIDGIQLLQTKNQKDSAGLYKKSLPDVVAALKRDPGMRKNVKDVVLLPPPAEGDNVAEADRLRHDVIHVSDERNDPDAIVIDVKLKHAR